MHRLIVDLLKEKVKKRAQQAEKPYMVLSLLSYGARACCYCVFFEDFNLPIVQCVLKGLPETRILRDTRFSA